MLSQFGEGGDGEEGGEGIADATRIALIGEGKQAGVQ